MIQNPLNHRSLLESRGCMDHVFDWYGFLEVLVDSVSKAILSKKWQLIKVFPFCFLGRRKINGAFQTISQKLIKPPSKVGLQSVVFSSFAPFLLEMAKIEQARSLLLSAARELHAVKFALFPKAGSMRWYHTSIVSYNQTNNVFFDSLSWNVLQLGKQNKISNPINWWSWTYSVTAHSFWEFGEPDPKGCWNAKMVCRDQTRFTRGSKYRRYEKSRKL